ncbi:MAG: hypothetical protein JWM08_2677 [Candidatus Angelobacter sp.]|nr:hypothetical protein [Candidatus Angelobacter sp.]
MCVDAPIVAMFRQVAADKNNGRTARANSRSSALIRVESFFFSITRSPDTAEPCHPEPLETTGNVDLVIGQLGSW